MTPRDDNLNEHDRFTELAAIATSGALTTGEISELRDHLQVCENCRRVYRQYRILAKEGLPMLAGRHEHWEANGSWDGTSARQKLFARIDEAEEQDALARAAHQRSRAETPLPGRNAARMILRAALAACLVASVGIGAYRLGSGREARAKLAEASARSRIEELLSAKRSVDSLLTAQTGRIVELQADSSTKRQEVENLRDQLQVLQKQWGEERASARAGINDLAAAKAGADEQLRDVSLQRDRLSEQLRDARQAYQNVQTELVNLRAERDKAMLRLASLETRVNDLTAVNYDQDRRLRNSEQYLASDRDIRELIGARNLYIADVFDVDSSSRTRKPFGRVFYTRGKSLIFYAFDLDQQPKVKNASAFQVWGQKETAQGAQAKPLNLGILYLDSESNRRWILRFDKPQTLAEIDAVFVTVEPHGGSPKPTGKPFLFAMLRKEANHP
jgi:hypothetical protein